MQLYVNDLSTGDILNLEDQQVTIDNFINISPDKVAVCGYDTDGDDYYCEYDLDDIVNVTRNP